MTYNKGHNPVIERLQQPDCPGRWWFTGIVRIETPTRPDGTSGFDISFRTPRLFDIRQEGSRLIFMEVRNHLTYPAHSQWFGWWVKQK